MKNILFTVLFAATSSFVYAAAPIDAPCGGSSGRYIPVEAKTWSPKIVKNNTNTDKQDSVFIAPNYNHSFSVVLSNHLDAKGVLVVKDDNGIVKCNTAFTGSYTHSEELPTGYYNVEVTAFNKQTTRRIYIE